jgi:hypothetical protein
MKEINRKEIIEKMNRGEEFKLVSVMGEWAFRAKHIAKSMNINTPRRRVQ